jgi:hypothetical protein
VPESGTPPEQTVNGAAAASFAALLPALLVAHHVGDQWMQTHHQATSKGEPGWPGRVACAKHVASYTAVTAATVLVLWVSFGLHISVWGFLAGQLVSAATHYWADRRTTLRWLAYGLGKGEFYDLGAPRRVRAVRGTAFADGAETVRLYPASDNAAALSGPGESWDNPSLGTGAYALDQAWHWGWLGVAAFLTALIP